MKKYANNLSVLFINSIQFARHFVQLIMSQDAFIHNNIAYII